MKLEIIYSNLLSLGSFPTKFETFEGLRRKAEIFGEGLLTLSDLKKSEITLW